MSAPDCESRPLSPFCEVLQVLYRFGILFHATSVASIRHHSLMCSMWEWSVPNIGYLNGLASSDTWDSCSSYLFSPTRKKVLFSILRTTDSPQDAQTLSFSMSLSISIPLALRCYYIPCTFAWYCYEFCLISKQFLSFSTLQNSTTNTCVFIGVFPPLLLTTILHTKAEGQRALKINFFEKKKRLWNSFLKSQIHTRLTTWHSTLLKSPFKVCLGMIRSWKKGGVWNWR